MRDRRRTIDSLFAPPTEQWIGLSPKYLAIKRVSSALTWLIVAAVPVVALQLTVKGPWPVAVGAIGLVLLAWGQWRLGRWFRRFGYAEREDDLYITRGLMWRSLTVIPYGRMQVVKVESGPLDRAVGVASVHLVTASAESNAVIPGLPTAEAERLRDRLSELGESRSAGM